MKIALLSDIHGNSIAFDAVLADIHATGGVDGYWILGDLVALGPDPVGVLERIRALPNVRVTRGNTDRYVTSGDRPDPTIGILPTSEAADIATLLADCDASLVCVGHTHQPSAHQSGAIHAINLGAVSLSVGPDTRSSFVLLDATDTHWRVTHRRVIYDRAAVIDQLNDVSHPARGYIIRQLSE